MDQPGVQCPTICPQGCESRLRSGQPLQLLKLHRQCLSKIMTRRRLPASSTRKLAGPSKGTSLRISRQRHLDKSTLPPERTSSAANEAPFCSAVMWAVFTLKPHTPQRSDTMRRTASQLHNSHASPNMSQEPAPEWQAPHASKDHKKAPTTQTPALRGTAVHPSGQDALHAAQSCSSSPRQSQAGARTQSLDRKQPGNSN